MTEPYLKAGRWVLPLRILKTTLIGLTVFVLGFGSGWYLREEGINSWLAHSKVQVKPLAKENLDFSLFWEVWDRLEAGYLEPDKINGDRMVYGAIQGMTAALGDPYTVFLPPEENQASKEDLNGEFDGVGIQLGYKNDMVAVMSPLEGHPAIKQGVKAGDLILNIKDLAKGVDTDTTGMTLTEAVKLIRGKRGTEVTLTLYRDDKGRFEVTMVRDTILVPGVELEFGLVQDDSWQQDPKGDVAWLKVSRFGERTDVEWTTAVNRIQDRRAELTGVVLDLRNNPGGYLQAAVDLASEFIPNGVVVKQQGRYKAETYEVSKRGMLIGQKLVVIINGGSASASEILAGALRDRLDVPLVGEKSFGKGTVQEALDLSGKAGLHMTIAKWLLPNGDWIHETGLTPDIEVKLPEETPATESAKIKDVQLLKAVEVLKGE